METKKIPITVEIDGWTVQPEGWMWVLSWAIAGVPWALNKALDPTYDMDGKLRNYNLRKKEYHTKASLARAEAEVAKYRARLLEIAEDLKISPGRELDL